MSAQTHGNSIKIVGINLDHDSIKEWVHDEDSNRVKFGQLNIFIGANNSGKSRLLRAMFSGLSIHKSRFNLEGFLPFLPGDFIEKQPISTGSFKLKRPDNIGLIPDYESDLLFSILFDVHDCDNEYQFIYDIIEKQIDKYSNNKDIFYSRASNSIRLNIHSVGQYKAGTINAKPYNRLVSNPSMNSTERLIQTYQSYIFSRIHIKRINYLDDVFYIPIHRGLRPILEATEEVSTFIKDPRIGSQYHAIERKYTDLYTRRVVKEYFDKSIKMDDAPSNLSEHFDAHIFTGLTLYQDIRSHLLGRKEARDRVRKYENFLSTNFFQGKSVELLPLEDQDVVCISIGEEADKPIYELGDGIQTIIMMTYKPFMEGKGVFFIEEPDLMLHPGMQRKLMDVFASMENCQFFITTHSNHLIDMAADYEACIYLFQKKFKDEEVESEPVFQVKPVDRGDIQALRMLGVRHSSSFLVNATIWVEGITDRLYFHKYLKEYQEQLPEDARRYHIDQHYAFVEYGGANIVHFKYMDEISGDEGIDVEHLCGNGIFIMDEDGIDVVTLDALMEEKKEQGDEALNTWTSSLPKVERRYIVLKRKIGDRVVVLPVRETENLLSPKVLINTVNERFPSKANYTGTFPAYEEYNKTYLGGFIHERFGDKYGTFAKTDTQGKKSGTITNKKDFCLEALKHITWETMSEDAQALGQRMYEHIAAENQR